MKRWFLTVDWCNKGNRGIFCNLSNGNAFSKEDSPHTEDEMWEILGDFDLVLSPKSLEFSEEEVAEYTKAYPLGEYSNQYGFAVKG